MHLSPPVEPLYLRHVPLAAAALWFAGGIALSRVLHPPAVILLSALLLLGLVSVASLWTRSRIVWLPIAAVWLVLGVAAAAWQPTAPLPVELLDLADNLSRTVDGTVTRVRVLPPKPKAGAAADADQVPPWELADQPAPDGEQALSVDLAVSRVEWLTPDISRMVPVSGGVRVTLYAPPASLADLGCGDRLELPLRMRAPDSYRDPGAFDYAGYLLDHDGIAARAGIDGDRVKRIGRSPASWSCRIAAAQGWAVARLSELVSSPANRWLSPFLRLNQNDAGMLSAMLFGDRTSLSKALRLDFERTGTFHLFVVSGLHIALLAAGLFWLLLRFRFPRWMATLGTIAGATLFAMLTGFGQPTQRALAMVSMYMLARLLARKSEPMNALGAATLAMLIWSPSSLFTASLQMTVLVIIAIAGIAEPLNRWIFRHVLHGAKDAWRHPRQSFHPVEAQARTTLELWGEAVTPVLGRWSLRLPAKALVFAIRAGELAVMGLVTELVLALPLALYFHRAAVLALPANMVVLPTVGLLASLAVATFAATLMSPWLAMIPAAGAATLLHSITWIILRLGHVSAADVRVPGPALWVALAALPLWLACCWIIRRARWGAWAVAAALPLIAGFVLWPEPALRTPGALELTAIDVGQGDSLLAIGPDGRTMLIDGGGPIGTHGVSEIVSSFDIGEQVVSPYLWTRRIRRLDVVVLTHAHTDHMGGLPAVLENFRPRELWVGIDPDSLLYRQLIAEAARLGISVRHLHAGDRPTWSTVAVQVLAPADRYKNSGTPKNDDSLVLRLQMNKASVLLEGDAERPSEDAMLDANLIQPVTLLKVGHHGSKTSSTSEFLAAAAPVDAVVSVGRNNPFGHPYGEVIDRFAARGTHLFRTDEFGLSAFLLYPDGSIRETFAGKTLPRSQSSPAQQVNIGQVAR